MTVPSNADPPKEGGTLPPAETPPAPIITPPITPPTPPPAPDPNPVDAEDAADGAALDGDQVRLPQGKFKTIKARARQRGEEAAKVAILAPVLAAGFGSLEELLATTQRKDPAMTTPIPPGQLGAPINPPGAPVVQPPPPAPAPPPPPVIVQPPPPPAPPVDDRALSPEARRRIREAEARVTEAEARATTAAKATADAAAAATATLAEQRVLWGLGVEMSRLEVDDVEYAIHLYDEHRKTLDDEGKKKLTAPAKDGQPSGLVAWLTELRKTKPALFKVTATPANTGNPNTPPSPPGPAQVAGGSGNGAKVDARSMTPDQWKAYCKDLGIRP